MLQKRLANSLEAGLRKTQYGFRANHSTSQPIHILRRLIEIHERQTPHLHMVFLDWKKAFDCITHDSIEPSLLRMGTPETIVKAIMSLYNDPKFLVRDNNNKSETQQQGRGVRQGCPLSPYLFIITLSVLLHDVEAEFVEVYKYNPWPNVGLGIR